MRIAIAALLAVSGLTLAGLFVLWPGDIDEDFSQSSSAATDAGTARAIETSPCPPPQPGECGQVVVVLDESEEQVEIPLGGVGFGPQVEEGDRVKVAAVKGPTGTSYNLVDFERGTPLLILVAAFAALVVLFGRLRGALSLLGLALSLAVIVLFMAPAMLDGAEPVAVAVVGSLAVMLVTITLAHGVGQEHCGDARHHPVASARRPAGGQLHGALKLDRILFRGSHRAELGRRERFL